MPGLVPRIPCWKSLCADPEEKHEPVSDIDTVVVDSLKELELKRPIRKEIWFADEARIGQKDKITRRWAKRGSRPSASRDQRTAATSISGAVCPKEGKGAALVLPACNTEAMNLHLVEVAETVARGVHAVLLADQAGWHMSMRLIVPPNITLIPLPPKCPGLNSV